MFGDSWRRCSFYRSLDFTTRAYSHLSVCHFLLSGWVEILHIFNYKASFAHVFCHAYNFFSLQAMPHSHSRESAVIECRVKWRNVLPNALAYRAISGRFGLIKWKSIAINQICLDKCSILLWHRAPAHFAKIPAFGRRLRGLLTILPVHPTATRNFISRQEIGFQQNYIPHESVCTWATHTLAL